MDSDHYHIGSRRSGTEHEHSDTIESINAQLRRHGLRQSHSSVYTTITSSHCPQLTESEQPMIPSRWPLDASCGRPGLSLTVHRKRERQRPKADNGTLRVEPAFWDTKLLATVGKNRRIRLVTRKFYQSPRAESSTTDMLLETTVMKHSSPLGLEGRCSP